MDVTSAEPDVKQIIRAQTTLRSSGVRANEPDDTFAIVIVESIWKAMQIHAHTRLDAEVGGVLLGKLCRDARETPYLLIDGYVPALAAESSASNVTFTAESWTTIHETIDRESPGASIVGWYHTHPSFGIFLSEMDVFIHRHFFDAPHQVAIVIDPVANTHGGFAWRAGVPAATQLLIESDDATLTSPVDFRAAFLKRDAERQRRAQSFVGRLGLWLDAMNARQKIILVLLAFLLAFAACCFVLMKLAPLLGHSRSSVPTPIALTAPHTFDGCASHGA